MPRKAHHRAIFRSGPYVAWRQRVAGYLADITQAVRAGEELLRFDIPGAPVAYQAARLRARVKFEKVAPLLSDEDGRAWE